MRRPRFANDVSVRQPPGFREYAQASIALSRMPASRNIGT